MRIFCSTTIFFFLALVVFGVSSFVVPAPCRSRAAAQHAQTTASSAVRRRQHHLDHVHTRPNEATTGRLVLAAAPRGGGGDGGDELEEKAGIEPKCEFCCVPRLEFVFRDLDPLLAGTLPSATAVRVDCCRLHGSTHPRVIIYFVETMHSCAGWGLGRFLWMLSAELVALHVCFFW